MEHAITIGDVLMIAGIGLGLIAVAGLCLLAIYLLNPFRSGH